MMALLNKMLFIAVLEPLEANLEKYNGIISLLLKNTSVSYYFKLKDGFIKVDYDYVVNSAKIAKKNGVKQFHLVSSAGANKDAMFLYPSIKGKAEEEIKKLEFDYFGIYRPK